MPHWSDTECRRYGATVTGEEAITQAAILAGPDGEGILREFLSKEFTPRFPKAEIDKVVESSLKGAPCLRGEVDAQYFLQRLSRCAAAYSTAHTLYHGCCESAWGGDDALDSLANSECAAIGN